jgi:hypothetical protein
MHLFCGLAKPVTCADFYFLETLAAHASNKLVIWKLEVNVRKCLELGGGKYLQKGLAKRTEIFLAECANAESLE